MTQDFDTEVVRGNKGGSDHEPNLRARNMVFTRPIDLGVINFDTEVMDYLAYAEETGKSGYKHYQGFVCWKSARWTFACKKKYGHYFGKMNGSLAQNDDYCSKQGTLVEFGVKPHQGERTDLTQIVGTLLNRSTTVDQIIVERPMLYHQYGRTLEKAEDIALRSVYRTEMTTCTWYVGKTGKGKSHRAFTDYDPLNTYVYRDDNGWWDDYRGEETVIINEFRGAIKYSELLQLIDKWPYWVKRRGRPAYPFTSKHIIITSALTPQETYHNLHEKDDLAQLVRRINVFHV